MLREYAQKLCEVYKEKGLVPAVKAFGKSVGEYLLLEANYMKMRQIQGDNKPFCDFPHVSRMYAEAVTRQPFRNVSNQDLDSIIFETKTDFLKRVN
jgi:hypothetical protein